MRIPGGRAPSRRAAGPSKGTSVAFALPPAVADLGDVRCRFGEYKGHVRLADATVSGAGEVRCATPPARAVGRVVPAVTLNGQQYAGTAPHAAAFEYFAVASRTPVPFPSTSAEMARPLAVRRVTPSGGPSLGGTLVTVGGTQLPRRPRCAHVPLRSERDVAGDVPVGDGGGVRVAAAHRPRRRLGAGGRPRSDAQRRARGRGGDRRRHSLHVLRAGRIRDLVDLPARRRPRRRAPRHALRRRLWRPQARHRHLLPVWQRRPRPGAAGDTPAGGGEALECTSPRANLSLADAPAIAPGAEGHQTSRTPDALRQARAPTPAAGAPAGTFVVPLRATRNGDVAALSNAVEFTYSPGDDADAHECAGVNEAGFS